MARKVEITAAIPYGMTVTFLEDGKPPRTVPYGQDDKLAIKSPDGPTYLWLHGKIDHVV